MALAIKWNKKAIQQLKASIKFIATTVIPQFKF